MFREKGLLLVTRLVMGGFCLACLGFAPHHHSEVFMRAYGPRAEVRIVRPVIGWEIWPGKGSEISSVQMTVDGKSVAARYDANTRFLYYVPEGPISAGTHTVRCEAMVDQSMPVDKDWDFKVTEDASELAQPTDSQLSLLDQINSLRASMGLRPALSDSRFAAAAMAHTKFLIRNNITGHSEKAGKPGFVAEQPGERLESFGYFLGCYEGVNYGSMDPEQSLITLFDAPYHRIPFMQSGSPLCGAAFGEGHMTVEFELSSEESTVVSPYAGQKDVPTLWHGNERPNPLRLHKSDGPIGYTIVFSHFSGDQSKIKLQSATLTDEDGNRVPLYINSPDNDDHLTDSAFLMPQTPMKPGCTYQVSVRAQSATGKDISKAWSFTTADNGAKRHLTRP